MRKDRHFSEYRLHDYRTPRSMRECYGWDARLSVDDDDHGWMTRWSSVMLWIIVALIGGALVWMCVI